MPEVETITRVGPLAVPYAYQLGATETLRPLSVFAHVDGTGASGAFLICVTFVDQNGNRFSRAFNTTSFLAGASGDVTWFPGGDVGGAGGSGSGWQFNQVNQGGWGNVTTANFDPAHGNFGILLSDTSGDNLGDGGIALETSGTPGQGISMDENTGAGISIAASAGGSVGVSSTANQVSMIGATALIQSNNGDLTLTGEVGDVRINVGVLGSNLLIHGLPVAAAGLEAGEVWNNGGVLNIV